MRLGKQPKEKLVEEGGGFRTPLQDMRFEDLVNVRGNVPVPSRMPSYAPRKPRKSPRNPKEPAKRRSRIRIFGWLTELLSYSPKQSRRAPSNAIAPILMAIAIMVAVLYVALRVLPYSLPYVSPDVTHVSGAKVYDARAVWGLGLYAIICTLGGIGIMLAWLRSEQN